MLRQITQGNDGTLSFNDYNSPVIADLKAGREFYSIQKIPRFIKLTNQRVKFRTSR